MVKKTLICQRLISAQHGMRTILKRKLPAEEYIRLAVESGTYKNLPRDKMGRPLKTRTSVFPYPDVYQILIDNPLTPDPPRITAKDRRRFARQTAIYKQQGLVEDYLRRHSPLTGQTAGEQQSSRAEEEEEHYRKLLGIPPPSNKTASIMVMKSYILNKAYAFALRQHQVMETKNLSKSESRKFVEDLLKQDAENERLYSRKTVEKVKRQQEKQANKEEEEDEETIKKDGASSETTGTAAQLSMASIFYNRPKMVHAMSIWSRRLQAVPYAQWTIGASHALDHWIARDVLDLSPETWESLVHGEDDQGAVGQDIIDARQALFPETIVAVEGEEEQVLQQAEESNIEDVDKKPTEQDLKMEELLLNLRSFEDKKDKDVAVSDDGGDSFDWGAFVQGQESDEDDDDNEQQRETKESQEEEEYQELVDELQAWREKNHNIPYADWNRDDKIEFQHWMEHYIATLTSGNVDEEAQEVDMEATREALLAPPPVTREKSRDLWDSLRDETAVELFLHKLRSSSSANDDGSLAAIFGDLPFAEQKERLLNLGALRPLLDEYTTRADQEAFLERHADKLFEGMVLEHLVPDPQEGWITESDVEGVSGLVPGMKYRLERLPYDRKNEREMLMAWNMFKAGRAKYEEELFRKGQLGLRYPRPSKKEK